MRISADNGERGDINYICPEELGSRMFEIIRQNVSLEKDALFRYLANLLGTKRVTDKISLSKNKALDTIHKSIDINGDIISYKD